MVPRARAMSRDVVREFSIELYFDHRPDGIYHIHGPSLPGFHLAGDDFAALKRDIEPVVKDLLFYNRGITVENIRWVPSLDDVQNMFEGPHEGAQKATYLAKISDVA